jgi:hypothetical protein
MVYFNKASFAPYKTILPASIGATYAAAGTALANPAVVLTFINATNGDILVSTDATNDMLFLSANSFRVFDIRTNSGNLLNFMFPKGTQFYVKDGTTVATTGAFYIEIVQVTE